jgi:hypothetical protein
MAVAYRAGVFQTACLNRLDDGMVIDSIARQADAELTDSSVPAAAAAELAVYGTVKVISGAAECGEAMRIHG